MDEVTVHDPQNRHLFSWHKNSHHLLFYVRHPALRAQAALRQNALAQHPLEKVNTHPSGETTITLDSESDAQTLINWLLPALPLP